MAACKCNYAKRMEKLIKAYKFDDKDPIPVLRFLAQFKRASALKGVSEGIELYIMHSFKEDGPSSSLAVCMTPYDDKEPQVNCQ